MTELIYFLAAPFAMCLILVGIHCYLGLHVLARGVIFVDLSLAQIACLGTTLAMLVGIEHHSTEAYFVSLAATFLAATLFALARKYEKTFSQEAIIGIVYAFASAAIILVVDRLAHGAEHIKEILVGQILWVTWADVFKTTIIYAVVGMIHYVFRKQIWQATLATSANKKFLWDLLFYVLFGVIITSSTRVAGVLQVFAYLIVPAITANAFYKTIKSKLLFGWLLGGVLSFGSLVLSHKWDLPAGAFIVVVFTAVPILLLLISTAFKLKPGSR